MSKLNVDNIHTRCIRTYYDDNTGTEIRETDSMLFYKTQVFYCKVDVEIPTCTADRDWSIGLVQACEYMHLANNYSDHGSSLWEFHPLKSGLRNLINDSDGRQYPFYSVNQSLYNIKKGPVWRNNISLQIKDYFHPSVVWQLPYKNGVNLTQINRHQKFIIWLVAIKYGKKTGKDEITVLKRIHWEYNLNLQIDPYMQKGSRVRKIYDVQDRQTIVEEPDMTHTKLPETATFPPHCNAAQSLIWYPKDTRSEPEILVPPKQVIVPWDRWVTDMIGPKKTKPKPPDISVINCNVSNR